MRTSSSIKNARIKEIAGRLIARDASRHYWIFNGSKWQRIGLKAIATMLHLGAAVVSTMFRMANNCKQATRHLPCTELATYAVLFVVLFVLSFVLVINASTLAEIELSTIPVVFMAITEIFAYTTLNRGVKA